MWINSSKTRPRLLRSRQWIKRLLFAGMSFLDKRGLSCVCTCVCVCLLRFLVLLVDACVGKPCKYALQAASAQTKDEETHPGSNAFFATLCFLLLFRFMRACAYGTGAYRRVDVCVCAHAGVFPLLFTPAHFTHAHTKRGKKKKCNQPVLPTCTLTLTHTPPQIRDHVQRADDVLDQGHG